MRILVAGSGFLGEVFAPLAVAAGHSPITVGRSARPSLPGVVRLQLDLRSPPELWHLPDDLDLVLWCAGAGSGDPAAYEELYLRGWSQLLNYVQRRSSPRVIYCSSTSVYGQEGEEWVNESSPTVPNSLQGRILLQAEALVPTGGTILRLSGLYGPGREGLLGRVQQGLEAPDAGPSPFTNRIHVRDVASAILHLVRFPMAEAPRLLLVSDEEPVRRNVLLDWLAGHLGRPLPTPQFRTRTRGGNKRCDSTRLRSTGFRFRFPSFREGYGERLAALPIPRT